MYPTKADADGPLPKDLLRFVGKGSAVVAKRTSQPPPGSTMPDHYVVYFDAQGKQSGAPVSLKPPQYQRVMKYSSVEGFGGGRRYPRDPVWIKAKYPGKDNKGKPFKKGDRVLYWPNDKSFMQGPEAEQAWREFQSQIADEIQYNMGMGSAKKASKAKQAGPMYSIGPGGLSPTQGKEMKLKPGIICWLRASSSPKQIIITHIDAKMITFREYPYTKDQRIERSIGEHLIFQGTSTWAKTYGSHYPDMAKKAKDLIAGKDVKPVNVAEYLKGKEMLQVVVRPTEGADWSDTRGKDPWYAAEEYGGVASMDSKESPSGMDYEIDTDHARFEKIKQDKRWKVIKVTKRNVPMED